MESRPKVLMFIDWYLPGFRAGGPIRSCINMVEHLGEHVDFFIVTSDRDYQSKVAYPDIPILQWITLDRGEKVMYMPPDQLDRSMLKRLTDEQHFDHVYIHGLFSKRFSILTHRHFSSTAIPVIIAPRGMLRRSAVSLKGTKKKLFLKAARWSGQYRNTTFHATDALEVKDIKKYFGDEVRIILAPNLPQKSKAPVQSISKRPGTLKLLFAGRIAPEKNLAFAIERMIDLEGGDVELNILGAVYDESYHQECLRLIDRLEGSIRVRILDPIAHDELKKVIKQHH
ncbi:MAG: hypothetical protein HKN79_12620, partial [Flavobacteriales bacterium]|nr:hypothetical protein [Flavobacteriales bacterium]